MIQPRPQEQLLIDWLPQLTAERVLCTTAGRGQFAAAFAQNRPLAHVTCFFLDLYQRDQAMAASPDIGNVDWICAADPPSGEVDLLAFPFSRQGDAELTRDLIQAGHERLTIGGQLIASSDNRDEKWLLGELQKLFRKVDRHTGEGGVVYTATKRTHLRKPRNFTKEIVFRDGERLLQLRTRPGVFSHRSVDGGARALINAMQIEAGHRVLDIGCGAGTVALAAAGRAPNVTVLAIDSNPRAIACLEWSARANSLANIHTALDATGASLPFGEFDVALANPPYYSSFRIAEIFVENARRALRPDGQLVIVTKQPEWYIEKLATEFHDVDAQPAKLYWIVTAKKKA